MGDTSVNYWEVDIPTEKDPSEYKYQARRADILRHYLTDAKHPDEVNWSRLAEYYERSKSTIHNDKETLLEFLLGEFDPSRVREVGVTLFEGAMREVIANDDYDVFDEIALYKKWIRTLDDLGLMDLDDEDSPEGFPTEEGDGLAVEISGVAGDDVDLSELPAQDRPGLDDSEQGEADADPNEAGQETPGGEI